MQAYLAALSLLLLMGMVIVRALWLHRSGIRVMNFGRIDKSDFLIPPFALFYFYTIFAAAFGWPLLSDQRFFHSDLLAWVGVFLCYMGLLFLLLSLIAFGKSFRVGIDTDRADRLVTSGVFRITRNPIYMAFFGVLIGQFLVFPNWVTLIYLIAGIWLIHRQVLREETFLQNHYGQEYADYSRRVRRYL